MKTQIFYLMTLLTVLVIGRGASEQVKCPRYCTCYVNITSSLRSVACVGKRLDNIDLSVPKRVQNLNLSNNSISFLEDRGFQNLGLIETVILTMKHNSIRSISLHSFAGLPYLESVDLSYNNLHLILPWTFHENSNMKLISLSGNPLGNLLLTGPFLDVPSLEELELSNCNFGHFSEESFSALPNLRRLDISSNQLVTLSTYTLQHFNSLKEIDISRNPWPCDMNLKTFRSFMDANYIKLKESSCDLQYSIVHVLNSQSPKFEKIISDVDIFAEFDSNDSESDSESDEDESIEDVLNKETLQLEGRNCECKPENRELFFKETSFILPPIWLALVSFQLGVCVTLFLGYCCTYCTRQKKKYQHLEQTESALPIQRTENFHQVTDTQVSLPDLEVESSMESLSCPDTPPPSYTELFMS